MWAGMCLASLALGLASRTDAGPPVAAAGPELRRLLASGYWPDDLPVRLDNTPVVKDKKISGLDRDSFSGATTRVAKSAFPEPSKSSGSAAPKPAVAEVPAVLAVAKGKLDEQIGQIQKLAYELDEAGVDYVRMLVGKQKRAFLRPLLLFLVERGILRAEEVEEFMLLTDADVMLRRIRARIEEAQGRRSTLEIQRLFIQNRIEAAK